MGVGAAAALVALVAGAAAGAVWVRQDRTVVAQGVPPAEDAVIFGHWAMTIKGNTVASMIGAENLRLHGPRRSAVGVVGTAVEFFSKSTAYGIAEGTEGHNPYGKDFAMGVTFTSEPVRSGLGFSGNVMQKGRANRQGQVKISTLPTRIGGATFCRVKGTNGYRLLKSKVVIDDGDFHTAVCWRRSSMIGLTVDRETIRDRFDPGLVFTTEPVRIGNQAAAGNWTDQHFGKNDCSVWAIGNGARSVAAASTPC